MAERPDRVSAALTARLQGSRVLVTDETTESKLTYANPDSTFTTETVSGIARVKQGERWVAVDTTLIEDNGVLRPRAAKAGVEFSAGGHDRPLARMSQSDKRSFALAWSAPLPKPVVKGNVAIYVNAAGVGADLVVTALPTGFRHDVVLRERPSGPVEFKLPVQTEGLRFAMTKQGGLELATPKGKVVASAPEPFMYDSSTAQRTPWSIPVTAIAQAWANGAAGHGLVLAPSDEPNRANTFGWYFDDSSTANPPKLVITYGSTPWTGRLRAIPMTAANNKFYVTTLTPVLAAEVNDADGGVLKAEFQVEHDPSVPSQGSGLIWSSEVDNVTANAEAKITIPAGKLADGWTVRWRARASDTSSTSAWSQWQPLNVDVTAPTISYFDCNYPAGQWSAQRQDAECWLGTDAVTVDEFNADDINTELWWGLDDPSTPNRITTGWGWSQGKLVNDFPITPGDGWHTVYIKVRDKAHNLSQVTTHSFGVGNGGIATPEDNSRTGQAVTLSAAAAPDYDKVRYEYRTSFLSSVDYTVIPTADVSAPGSSTPISSWPQSRTDTSKNFAT